MRVFFFESDGFPMPTFDQTDSECVVYVYREGIASAVGHDLAIEVTDFDIAIDEGGDVAVEAQFVADSLRVLYAMDDGQPARGKLSERDKSKIQKNIRKEVLESRDHPVIKFESTDITGRDGGVRIEGVLSLHGVEKGISFDARRSGDGTEARIRLHQPDFDIKPYRALLGALKLKPEVDVAVIVPYLADSA